MKSSPRTSRILLPISAFALLLLSSCNRGMGCPTNFSVNEILESSVASLIGLLF